MRLLIRFLRIYTPFICTLMALLNGVLFMMGDAHGEFVYITSALTGNSIAVVLYMFCTSMRMCIWYKLNLLCLLLIQVLGITYDCLSMDFTTYLLAVVMLSMVGIICFLIFQMFYRVTSLFTCTSKHL